MQKNIRNISRVFEGSKLTTLTIGFISKSKQSTNFLQILEYLYALDIVSNLYLNLSKYSLLFFKSHDFWIFHFFPFSKQLTAERTKCYGTRWEFCEVFHLAFWHFMEIFDVFLRFLRSKDLDKLWLDLECSKSKTNIYCGC